jgi:hypothetical protein
MAPLQMLPEQGQSDEAWHERNNATINLMILQPTAPEATDQIYVTTNLITLFKNTATDSTRSDGNTSIICTASIVCTRFVISTASIY